MRGLELGFLLGAIALGFIRRFLISDSSPLLLFSFGSEAESIGTERLVAGRIGDGGNKSVPEVVVGVGDLITSCARCFLGESWESVSGLLRSSSMSSS
jgi:hypothetical protein